MDSRQRAHEFLARSLDGTKIRLSHAKLKAALVVEFDEVRRLALEEACLACGKARDGFLVVAWNDEAEGANECAVAIRSLMSAVPQEGEK